MNVGINLSSVTYWSTEEPFIDRIHTGQGWVAKDAAGKDVTPTVAHDANGDITDLTGISSLSVAIAVDPKSASPRDEYVLTFNGAASVKITNATVVSQAAGRIVFDYTGPDNQAGVILTFKGLNPSAPIMDVHVVRSDQQGLFASGEVFNPDFVAKVSQWSAVRFMDWSSTNESDVVSLSTRTTESDVFWSKQATSDGVPLEAMVKLANEAHVDMWYNVPTKADDAYVKSAMAYIRDHLDPSLKVHVEYSNEVWNAGFAANGYAAAKANALWGGGATVQAGSALYYGYRSAQIAQIAHTVFSGSHAGQLLDVLGSHAADASLVSNELAGIAKAGLGSASSLFKELAIAPYFGSMMGTGVAAADLQTIVGWAKGGAAGMDAAFKALEFGGGLAADTSLAKVAAYFPAAAALAKASGLALVAYEGGASLATTRWSDADKPIVQDFFGKLMNDPRMGDLYTKLVTAFKAAGGAEFLAFNDVSGNATSGYWGVLDSIYDDGSPRYDALIAAAKAGQVSTIPSVGDDALVAHATGGLIDALAGNDTVTAGVGNDTIMGGDGNDRIVGSSGTLDSKGRLIEVDYYNGGQGADTIIGGAGNDHIYGNASTVDGHAPDGADSLSGGAGIDVIRGDSGDDTISGGDGNDNLSGDDGNDRMLGDAGSDILSGGGGADVLSGGDGNDTLIGDASADTLTGGAGQDVFKFTLNGSTFKTSGASAYVMDEVTDFTTGTDKLALGFHPGALLQGSALTVAAATSWAANALVAHAGAADVVAVQVGADTYLFYDDHGVGGALDAGIRIDHVTSGGIALTDFV